MFCPKCAANNLEGASYCRVCGENISLIPQALSGQLAQTPEVEESESCGFSGRRRGRRAPSLDAALKNAFMGVAFLLVAFALAFSRMGRGWWFWMLIPAFSMMATGLEQYVRLKEKEKRPFANPAQQPSFQPPAAPNSFPSSATGELVSPPPSVTEGTTRHLGVEAPTRHFEK